MKWRASRSFVSILFTLHDDGVNAFGLKQPDILLEWMDPDDFTQ